MPKKPTNPNTWQGQILDSVEEVRLLVEAIATGGPGASATDWTNGTCAGCAHFNEVGPGVAGEGRRVPPAIMDVDPLGTTGSTSPGVLVSFSCSEWRAT